MLKENTEIIIFCETLTLPRYEIKYQWHGK